MSQLGQILQNSLSSQQNQLGAGGYSQTQQVGLGGYQQQPWIQPGIQGTFDLGKSLTQLSEPDLTVTKVENGFIIQIKGQRYVAKSPDDIAELIKEHLK